MSHIEIRDNLDQRSWDAFVTAQPEATFYQLYGWREVLSHAFKHKSHYLSAHRDSEIVGILPLTEVKSRLFGHSLVSTGFCVGGGPLAIDKEALASLLDAGAARAKDLGVGHLELRDAQISHSDYLPQEGLHSTFEREIAADEQECLKQIPRKQRAVVRKTLTSELRTTIDSDIRNFYGLLSLTYRNHGTPVFPRRYFEALLSVFKSDADVLTVWDGEKALSSVMSFYIRDRVTPYYTGSVDAARGTGSNDLMYWQLMRHASAEGYRYFDFGRSKNGTGPYSFKKNWGFEPKPVTNWYFLGERTEVPNINPTNPKFQMAIKVWQKLPLPLANFLSSFVSPSLA